MITSDVENFPGFAEGIMGPDLMDQMRQQAARVGAEFLTENVSTVDFSQASLPCHHRRRQRVLGQNGYCHHRRVGQMAGPALGNGALRQGRLHLRDLRRLLFPQPRSRGGRRRRHGSGRSQLSGPHGLQSDADPPAGHAARRLTSCRSGQKITRKSTLSGTASSSRFWIPTPAK